MGKVPVFVLKKWMYEWGFASASYSVRTPPEFPHSQSRVVAKQVSEYPTFHKDLLWLDLRICISCVDDTMWWFVFWVGFNSILYFEGEWLVARSTRIDYAATAQVWEWSLRGFYRSNLEAKSALVDGHIEREITDSRIHFFCNHYTLLCSVHRLEPALTSTKVQCSSKAILQVQLPDVSPHPVGIDLGVRVHYSEASSLRSVCLMVFYGDHHGNIARNVNDSEFSCL